MAKPSITFTGNGDQEVTPLIRIVYEGRTTITDIVILASRKGETRSRIIKALAAWFAFEDLKLQRRSHRKVRIPHLERRLKVLGGALHEEFGGNLTAERRVSGHTFTGLVTGDLPDIDWRKVS